MMQKMRVAVGVASDFCVCCDIFLSGERPPTAIWGCKEFCFLVSVVVYSHYSGPAKFRLVACLGGSAKVKGR